MTSTSTLAWQAWHLWHWAGSGGALGFRCGAGTPRLLAWQAWHLETSIFVSRGRCGARAQLVVTQLTHTQLAHTQLVITPRAHIQLVVTQLTLAWQVWHLWHWAGSGGALGFRCGAGTPRLSAWQAWHLWHWAGSGGALGFRCGAGTLRLLAWQAWHLETSILVSRGRRATSTFAWQLWHVWQLAWRHPSSFHVAGVVLAHNLSSHNLSSHNLLTHSLHTHNLSSHHLLTHNLSSHNLLWRGRCGTYGTGLALVARLVLGVAPGRRGCWRGRCGTWRHPSSFHVAGVRLPLLRGNCGTYGSWRGRRGIWRYPLSFHLAGIVLGDIDLHSGVAGKGWLWWRAWF